MKRLFKFITPFLALALALGGCAVGASAGRNNPPPYQNQ